VSKAIGHNIKLILFLVCTIGMLIFLFLLVNKIDFGGGQLYTIRFDYIGTINIGSPVRKSGVKIGSVKAIEISQEDQKTVYATLQIRNDQIVRAEDRFAIVTGGILGDQFIEVFPGDQRAGILNPGAVIEGEKALDLNALAIEGGTLLKELSQASKVVNRVLTENEDRLTTILTNLETITTDLKVFSQSAKEIGEAIPTFTREIQDAASMMNRSISDFSTQGAQLLEQMENQLSTNQDSLKLAMDNISGLSRELLILSREMNQEGSVLKMLSDPEVSQDLRITLSNLRKVTDDIRGLTQDLLGAEDEQDSEP